MPVAPSGNPVQVARLQPIGKPNFVHVAALVGIGDPLGIRSDRPTLFGQLPFVWQRSLIEPLPFSGDFPFSICFPFSRDDPGNRNSCPDHSGSKEAAHVAAPSLRLATARRSRGVFPAVCLTGPRRLVVSLIGLPPLFAVVLAGLVGRPILGRLFRLRRPKRHMPPPARSTPLPTSGKSRFVRHDTTNPFIVSAFASKSCGITVPAAQCSGDARITRVLFSCQPVALSPSACLIMEAAESTSQGCSQSDNVRIGMMKSTLPRSALLPSVRRKPYTNWCYHRRADT